MKVTVHLHTTLQRQTPEGMVSRLDVMIPSGYTLADLLEHLEIDLDLQHLLLAVNGRVAEPGQIIQDDDQINLMPAISGGSPPANMRLSSQ